MLDMSGYFCCARVIILQQQSIDKGDGYGIGFAE